MGNNLLELTGVSAELQRKRIIDTINLAVPKRSRVSIIGTSGCGKSTLLKLIAGLHGKSQDKQLSKENVLMREILLRC